MISAGLSARISAQITPNGTQINPVQKVPPIPRPEPGPTNQQILDLYDKAVAKDPNLTADEKAAGRRTLQRLLDIADARRREGGAWKDRCGDFQRVVITRFMDAGDDDQAAKDWNEGGAQKILSIQPIAWSDLTKKLILDALATPPIFSGLGAWPKSAPPSINDPGHIAIQITIKVDPPVVFFVDDWLVGGIGRSPTGSKGGIFFPGDIPSDFKQVR
jgi:hypothetical protein